jgi:type I restriction enzyme, S subunit
MNQSSPTITNPQLKEGYKQTEVGVIPEDWKCVELDQLNPFITSGSRGWADFYSEYGDPFVRITNMFRESISLDLQDLRYVNLPIGASEGKRTQLYDGDLLISITADIGIISYVDERLQKPAYINQHIALVRFDKDKVNGKFISYFLSHESSQKWFKGGTDQGAKAGMSLITVRKIKTAIPPLPEQEAIACTLSDIDALIESLDRLLTKKRQIKQGAMQELLRSKDGWETTNLGSLGSFTKGSGVRKDESLSGSLPCIRYGEIYTKHDDYIKHFYSWISQNVAETATRLKTGDLLFSGSGETKEAIGKCVAFIDDIEAYAGGDIVILRLANSNAQFMGYYLNTSPVVRQKASKGQGDAVVHIGANALASIQVTIPTLEEQIEIANILSDMDAEIGSISAKLTKIRQLKQGMMHELLTGRIRLVES